MKSFQDNSFLNAFHRVLAKARPTPLSKTWTFEGVTWTWDRHAFSGQEHAFNTEIYLLKAPAARADKKPWTLRIVFDTWRGADDTVLRQTHWSKLLHGQRTDALGWFRKQEAKVL